MSPIHVIVPVYRGQALTRRCLESLSASSLPNDCRVTLIDDASPEAGMTELLESFAHCAGWDVLRNATNLGFVASANLGMARHPDHDILLLNSDTEVPPGWLQRLRTAAYRDARTGTVTPFSNSGSLASYPIPSRENSLPEGITLPSLDRLFQLANAGHCIDIPTGVGFCLYIRRDCLEATGMLDVSAFGKGYGEENDFCLRASALGWKHMLAADCFVFHQGRASFGDTKDERVRRAYATLVARHPDYPMLIQRHFAADPARLCRLRVDALRLAHNKHGNRLATDATLPDTCANTSALLRLHAVRSGLFELIWSHPNEAFKLWFRLPEETNDLLAFLASVGVMNFGALEAGRERQDGGHGHAGLFELVARHSHPRLSLLQACNHALAHLGLRLSEARLLRPLAACLPQSARMWICRRLRAGGS